MRTKRPRGVELCSCWAASGLRPLAGPAIRFLPLAEVTFQMRPPVIGQLPWSGYHHNAPPRTGPLPRFMIGSALNCFLLSKKRRKGGGQNTKRECRAHVMGPSPSGFLLTHPTTQAPCTPALAHTSSLGTDLTRNTRAPHFTPQHWLLCHMGLY